ncbi:unnamed protein product [Phytomonas sp. EM1]|nr:unnamed protein product [Phytomonas sp. EM1]|eukprot:CCW62308.1 unnamed protein product [Phytomonas sp. isolate EM1]
MLNHRKRERDNSSRTGESSGLQPRPNVNIHGFSHTHSASSKGITVSLPEGTSRVDTHRVSSPKSSSRLTSARNSESSTAVSSSVSSARCHPHAYTTVSSRMRQVRGGAAATTNAAAEAAPKGGSEGLDPRNAVWKAKRVMLEAEIVKLDDIEAGLSRDLDTTVKAIEEMLSEHEGVIARLEECVQESTAFHVEAMRQLSERENTCRANKQRALERIEQLKQDEKDLQDQRNALQEDIIIAKDRVEQLQGKLNVAQDTADAEKATLRTLIEEEKRMQDAAYGLTGEAKEMVMEMERLRLSQRQVEVAAMETEVVRRELYAKCEELKGSIRVFCRVKGDSLPTAICDAASETSSVQLSPNTAASKRQRGSRRADILSVRSNHIASDAGFSEENEETDIFSYSVSATQAGASASSSSKRKTIDRERESGVNAEEKDQTPPFDVENPAYRTICVHQTRSNATSTATHSSTECFAFDRVFDGRSSQEDVYKEVEPLVHSAVDGYHVCVFAYGQTGSGKTYTMEGLMASDATHGIAPRALRTIFTRQEELAREGWRYTMSCSVVEIYNDVVRDLLQNPSVYEPGGAGSTANYHAIHHHEQSGETVIRNTRTRRIATMEDFRSVYRQATQHRRTAKTQLNDHSSRSHSIFTLRIDGRNETIRQQSKGVLCLVDLAGSERVNESGAQGQQFKEAVNINRSLLDLGKCISALRSGSVVPWRNSRLTYLLQNYLGAKGAKMLMVVTVSNKSSHLTESTNSLRFATRVRDTIIGSSVKRVSNF